MDIEPAFVDGVPIVEDLLAAFLESGETQGAAAVDASRRRVEVLVGKWKVVLDRRDVGDDLERRRRWIQTRNRKVVERLLVVEGLEGGRVDPTNEQRRIEVGN